MRRRLSESSVRHRRPNSVREASPAAVVNQPCCCRGDEASGDGGYSEQQKRRHFAAVSLPIRERAESSERSGRSLYRTTRKVSLTEVGRAYYERCTGLLTDLEETERAVSDMHAAPRGDLRVNATPCLGAYCLGPAIADFAARAPQPSRSN